MRQLWCALILTLGLVVGCASEGDPPSWRRPGLSGTPVAGSLSEALKDARGDNLKMQDELPANQRSTGPRPPSRPDW